MFSMVMQAAEQLRFESVVSGSESGAPLEARNDVEYVHMTTRSILDWCQGRTMRDVYAVNPYRGCEFGCSYCYARYTHEFLRLDDQSAFERRIYVKVDAPIRCREEVLRKDVFRHGIVIGTATDPYQPAERLFRVTRRILEELLPHRGIPLSIVTKGTLIRRDVPLLAALSERHDLTVGMSFATLDPELNRVMEPRAPAAEARFRTMAALARAGIHVALYLMPILPGLTDDIANLEALILRAKRAGATSVASNVLWLSSSARRRFFPWLEAHFPELHARYRAAYREGMYEHSSTRRRLQWRVQAIAAKHGFS